MKNVNIASSIPEFADQKHFKFAPLTFDPPTNINVGFLGLEYLKLFITHRADHIFCFRSKNKGIFIGNSLVTIDEYDILVKLLVYGNL